MAEPRRTFGPVVLVGLAGAGLAALGGTRRWVDVATTGSPPKTLDDLGVSQSQATLGEMPAAGALALVVLACWGVLLVTRGLVRRIVAVLALLVSLSVGVVSVFAIGDLRQSVPDTLERAGITENLDTTLTLWFPVTLVGVVLTTLAAVAAIRFAPSWPEMGRRYDAPVGQKAPVAPLEEQSSLDVWNAIGEGQDPTVDPAPDPPAESSSEPPEDGPDPGRT